MPVTIDVTAQNSINPGEIHSIRNHLTASDLHRDIPLDTGACSNDILMGYCSRLQADNCDRGGVAAAGSRSSIRTAFELLQAP